MSENSSSWSFYIDELNPWAYWSDGFNSSECDKIIDYCKSKEMLDGIVTEGTKEDKVSDFSVNKKLRDSKICFIQPKEEISWLYQKLSKITTILNEQYFNFDLWGFSEGLQFTQYQAPGQMYNEHVDTLYKGPIRKLSIVLQLTDENEYEGGDLEIIASEFPLKLIRKRGTLLAFPSYTLHRVTPVTKGTRHSLVGWVTGKPFK